MPEQSTYDLHEPATRARAQEHEGGEGAGLLQMFEDNLLETLDRAKDDLAASLEEFAGSIERQSRRLSGRGGVAERGAGAALGAVDLLDRASLYLHTHDVDEIRDDVASQIRRRPLLSVGIAFGAGVALSRILAGDEDDAELDRYAQGPSLVGRLVREGVLPLMTGRGGWTH